MHIAQILPDINEREHFVIYNPFFIIENPYNPGFYVLPILDI